MSKTETQEYMTIDPFDKLAGALEKLPTVTKSVAASVTRVDPLVGRVQTYVVQTYREQERGDFIFIQYLDGEGSKRIVLLPAVADAIARQRDQLSTKIRKAHGKRLAAARKARGELPGFMKAKANGKPKKATGRKKVGHRPPAPVGENPVE